MSEVRSAPSSPTAQDFQMVRRAPCAALSGIVTELIGYRETQSGHFRQFEPASLIAPLVISFGQPFSIAFGREPGQQDRIATFAAGLSRGHIVINSFGAAYCLQVNFTPLGAWRFFGLPMQELADRMVTLNDIWGSQASLLGEQLHDAAEWDRRFDLVERLILARTSDGPDGSPIVRHAYQMLVRGRQCPDRGDRPKAGLQPQASCPEISNRGRPRSKGCGAHRALWSGIFPCTIGDGDLADIAVECGYADQAHLGREFRTLSGKTTDGRAVGYRLDCDRNNRRESHSGIASR